MQSQFQFIVQLAAEYKFFAEQPDQLYSAINKLPEITLQEIFKDQNIFLIFHLLPVYVFLVFWFYGNMAFR